MPRSVHTTLTSFQIKELSTILHSIIHKATSRAERRTLLAQLRSYGIVLEPFHTAMDPAAFVVSMTENAQLLFISAVSTMGMPAALSEEEIVESLGRARKFFENAI